MKYDYINKNSGKDLIYQNRLKLAEKLNVSLNSCKVEMYHYLMNAELGIILN